MLWSEDQLSEERKYKKPKLMILISLLCHVSHSLTQILKGEEIFELL
jgi:hypothetical protein